MAEEIGFFAPSVYQDGAGRFEGTAGYGNYRRFETEVGEIEYRR